MSLTSKSHNPFITRFAAGSIKWNLWNSQTLKRAAKGKKPIFLYVHDNDSRWSHAMRENLKNGEITKLLNDDFIPVIADAHDSPKLALASRAISIMMTERAGRPLMAFLTPDLKPIFGASYMPQTSEDPKNPGLLEVLRRVKWLWLMKNEELVFAAESYREQLAKALAPYKAKLSDGLAERAAKLLLADADTARGGFAGPPKFPHAPRLTLAMYLIDRSEGSEELKEFVKRSLDGYYAGAMYDHTDGGFFDYCADTEFRMPYLSKHLAANVSLMEAYLSAYASFGSEVYRKAFEGIYESLGSFRTDDELYCSGDDAYFSDALDDYYLTENRDIISIEESAARTIFEKCEITAGGNHVDPLTHKASGKHVLYLKSCEAADGADEAFLALKERRERKKHPPLEKCVRIAENAYLAAVLASASRTLMRPDMLNEAESIMEVIYYMNESEDRLCRVIYGSREFGSAGVLEMACIIYALLEIYKATKDSSCLEMAEPWADKLLQCFGAEGAFRAPDEAAGEIVPTYDAEDDILPNANGLAACTLITLAGITGKECYAIRAKSAIEAFAAPLNDYPGECTSLVIAALRSGLVK